ncbi:hypothetical protein FPCIR_2523 [Fusarium pseudocircinatum]|uniref:Uncharacterized protein n=1 Tax=Fusarium pseudocircinatum TaxID=56676 RepID=A0A8H5PLS6_9HYPO|nr:hypothetical protein FPCIR_2523 [Fusarium pseudocircinatum]
MDGKIVNDRQERKLYAYSPVQHQQAFPEPVVSPQPSLGQFPPQAVSPESIARETFPHQSLWIGPQSPNLRDTPDYDRAHDSHRGLMGHAPVNDTYSKVPDVHVVNRPTAGALPESGPLMLRIMKSRWSMIACLVIGVAGAIGHHFLYMHLDGQEAKHQQWWIRLGQLISFIANANSILAAVIAHQQVAWRAVGQKGFSIHAVDALFGATYNIVKLFNREA